MFRNAFEKWMAIGAALSAASWYPLVLSGVPWWGPLVAIGACSLAGGASHRNNNDTGRGPGKDS